MGTKRLIIFALFSNLDDFLVWLGGLFGYCQQPKKVANRQKRDIH